MAYDTAHGALPKYSHKFSPKKFTVHQLVAMLVLQQFFDAGYDSEASHEFAEAHGVRTTIPPTIGRPTDKPPAGEHRRHLQRHWHRFRVTTLAV